MNAAMCSWWQRTTIYQIYPRSFYDANGDGIGDLPGITAKLDYIKDLGFETIWISPFFPSPLADHGYDISDYCGIAPEYGTMSDFEELLATAHARGLKIVLDLVLNHTSDQHPWFLESRRSRTNPKSDWYIWADGRGPNRPPNNWVAMTKGSAWHYVDERGQWYMASFLPFQPDLNWRNPELKRTMFEMVRYWLRKGVDGFRLDIFSSIMKDAALRDNPFRPDFRISAANPTGRLHRPSMQLNHPDTFALAKELRAVVREFDSPDRMLVGEVFGSRQEHVHLLGGMANDGLNLVFIFDFAFFLPWQLTARYFRSVVKSFERHFPPPLQPTYVFGNHDQRRLASKIGDDHDLGRVLALLQLTARGVPTVYMGEEIAMTDVFIPRERAQDPVSHLFAWVPDWVRRRIPMNLNRDQNRTPMQWTPRANAGFCPPDIQPWLPVNENHTTRNVETQLADPHSLLSWYRAVLRLRNCTPALQDGPLELIDGVPGTVLAYARGSDRDRLAVYLNFGRCPVEIEPAGADLLLGSHVDVGMSAARLTLPPKSGAVTR